MTLYSIFIYYKLEIQYYNSTTAPILLHSIFIDVLEFDYTSRILLFIAVVYL